MAFRAFTETVTDTPAVLFEAQAGDLEVWIKGATPTIWVGGQDLANTGTSGLADNGVLLEGSMGPFNFHTEVRPGDKIYATNATSGFTTIVRLLVRSASCG